MTRQIPTESFRVYRPLGTIRKKIFMHRHRECVIIVALRHSAPMRTSQENATTLNWCLTQVEQSDLMIIIIFELAES